MIKQSLVLSILILMGLVALGLYDNSNLPLLYRFLVGAVLGAFVYSLLHAIRNR